MCTEKQSLTSMVLSPPRVPASRFGCETIGKRMKVKMQKDVPISDGFLPPLKFRSFVELETIDPWSVSFRLQRDTRCANALSSTFRCNARLWLLA